MVWVGDEIMMDKSINVLLKQEFPSTSGLTPEFDNFFRVFSSEFRSLLKKEFDVVDVKISRGHNYISGFFKQKNGEIWYFNLGDVRWNKGDMLVRSAKGFDDFTGGSNQSVSTDNANRFVRELHNILG